MGSSVKRFENKVQLLRYIESNSEKEMDELWREYDRQVE